MKRILGVGLVLCLVLGIASASALTASGTVTPGKTVTVSAPIGGTVETVNVEKGMTVAAGDVLAVLKTNKVYAPQDGTVTGVFVSPGDDAAEVTTAYGAVMYLEGSVKYTVSGSTSKAYSSEATTFVHVGETVYLVCRSNSARTGVGLITAVDGSSYTVQVADGNFIVGDSVSIFRDEAHTADQKLGQGSVSRVSPAAVTAEGAVVSVAVKDGDTVKKGDLLMETLEGTWAGYVMTGNEIKADEAGVVAEVAASEGTALSQGAAAVTLYPLSGMRVETVIAADDLKGLKAGDTVGLELTVDESKHYTGTVSRISSLAEEDTEEVSYRVYIDFTPDEAVSFGMSMEITIGEETAAEQQEETETPAEEKQEETTEENTEKSERKRPERPEGFPEGKPENLPEGFPGGRPDAAADETSDAAASPEQ